MLEKSRFDTFMHASRWLRWAQFVIALVIFCYAALSPSPQLIGQHSDTSMHFVGNVLLTLSAWLAVWGRLSILKVMLCLLPFSLGIELAQYFAPGRMVDVKDMLMNTAGLGVGALLALLAQMGIKRILR